MPSSAINLDKVTQAATEAARDSAVPLRVVGIVPEGGSDYVEIVLRVEGCHKDPCQIQLGVMRDAPLDALRAQIREQLQRHLSGR